MMAIREKPWTYPEPGTPRGGLPATEEADIRDTPRPAKSPKQQEAEAERRLLRAVTRRHPHDAIPLQLHESRRVDESGAPEMVDAFLRYLAGEHAKTQAERHMELVLLELQRTNRPLWALLEEHFFFKRSIRDIAEQMRISRSTVQRVIIAGILDMQRRVVELFGTNA